MRWHRNLFSELYWHRWDNSDQYVLFNTASGQTHYLSRFAVDLLGLFSIEPIGFVELCERLSSLYDGFELDVETKNYLHKTLADSESFGLIDSELA